MITSLLFLAIVLVVIYNIYNVGHQKKNVIYFRTKGFNNKTHTENNNPKNCLV